MHQSYITIYYTTHLDPTQHTIHVWRKITEWLTLKDLTDWRRMLYCWLLPDTVKPQHSHKALLISDHRDWTIIGGKKTSLCRQNGTYEQLYWPFVQERLNVMLLQVLLVAFSHHKEADVLQKNIFCNSCEYKTCHSQKGHRVVNFSINTITN